MDFISKSTGNRAGVHKSSKNLRTTKERGWWWEAEGPSYTMRSAGRHGAQDLCASMWRMGCFILYIKLQAFMWLKFTGIFMKLSEFLPLWSHIFKRYACKIKLIFLSNHIGKMRFRRSVSIQTLLNINRERGIHISTATDMSNNRTSLYIYVW
jgi:hypothetical protein